MKRFECQILVTRPYLPPLDEFKNGLEEVWSNQWLTNNGPMLQRFQKELSRYLGVPETNIALFNNGTLALELGYYVMGLAGGEVITTPFTFVATSHALMRIGARPVFADIDPETMCLDPAKAEKLITPRTKAIVPVHVYGNVCDVEGFERLGEKYGVKIIYDAAHAFGVFSRVERVDRVEKKSIGFCGDMSMFSFHPTKLFHSCEGGLLVFKDAAVREKLYELRNFAIRSETECVDVGTNAKMNELQALMGICCLRKMPELLEYRQKIYEAYEEVFADCEDVKLVPHSQNKAYVPVLFKSFAIRERVYAELKTCNVFSRRYFYPLLTDFAPYAYGNGSCPIAEDLASRVLTLPTYYGLPLDDVKAIAENVKEMVK
ncbi:MAG: DegT/DnrJ/EryC1/StrS family aminotransferase [Kiritimatiellae bacterium]|nr:DegT/DnrJ/EryC1/StrS family aminotransferase [Bacteroidales bacterium]MBR3222441.1 DegT/DnrJ/EryC1/StrS family aminotransferase [Kiritimatiellia bacterium]